MNNIYEKYKKLELNIILDKLWKLVFLDSNKDFIYNINFYRNIENLRNELNLVDEIQNIIKRYSSIGIYFQSDLKMCFSLLSKGHIISLEDLLTILNLLKTLEQIIEHAKYLIKNQIYSPEYQKIVENIVFDEKIYQKISLIIDEDLNILDTASSNLFSIRKRIFKAETNIRERLNSLISQYGSKLSQTTFVIRNDRYCLPIKSDFKNSVKGSIQDVSASSQTVYIEPQVIQEINFQIEKLKEEEKEEIYTILKNISTEIYESLDTFSKNYKIIEKLDLLFAKAKLSISYDGAVPRVNSKGELSLIKARHPLLNVEHVVPNDIVLPKDIKGIIITGPNTGGKTVLLKTIGLFSLMIKLGLLLPLDASSNIPIYEEIYQDIGDDQSIENNLSTFSSHLINTINIVNHINENSLVLFDELGAGTDPTEGSNLAIAILRFLLEKKTTFITTTHYSSLKAFGFTNDEVINASMEFNDETLMPTYKLLIGQSGASNAFNIAKRLGLKQEIIDNALNLNNASKDSVNQMMQKLEKLIVSTNLLEKENTLLKKELDQQVIHYQKLLNEAKSEKDKIINDALFNADKILSDANEQAHQVIEQLKNLKKEDLKYHEILKFKDQLPVIKEKPKKLQKLSENEVFKGMNVYIPSYDQYGVVTKIFKDATYLVEIGNINIRLGISDLEKSSRGVIQDESSFVSFKASKAKLTLDLRGKRYEEAKEDILKYLDDLRLSGLKQATIIHGYGTGTIRNLVQELLKKDKDVLEFRYGGEGEGGLGVTVLQMK